MRGKGKKRQCIYFASPVAQGMSEKPKSTGLFPSALPDVADEAQAVIFSFLSFEDLQTARRVNKTWLHVADSFKGEAWERHVRDNELRKVGRTALQACFPSLSSFITLTCACIRLLLPFFSSRS